MSNFNSVFARAKTLPRDLQLKLAKELLEDKVAEKSPESDYPTMHLDSKPGDKVRFSYPNNGYPSDQKQVADYKLVVGTIYTIADINVGRFSSTVKLMGIGQNAWFNTVHFS